MYITTPTLSIEITRRCNLNCNHCARGDAENCDISRELLEKLFDEVKYAQGLIISGGEPFLCYEQIKMLIEVIKSKQIMIPKVMITTNGTIFDERIYDLLEENFKNISIIISIDDYHVASMESLYSEKELDAIFENIEMHQKRGHLKGYTVAPKYLIDMGRARNLDVPKKPMRMMGYFYSDCMPKALIVGPTIYLDCLGYITEGDSEYRSRKELSIGNLNEETLTNMILNNAVKINVATPAEAAHFLFEREKAYGLGQEKRYVYQNNKLVEEELKVTK